MTTVPKPTQVGVKNILRRVGPGWNCLGGDLFVDLARIWWWMTLAALGLLVYA
jgi:hypothetical protein